MRYLKLLLLLLLVGCPMVPAEAQNTTVTATVTDSDGTAWANGTWKIVFTPGGQATSPSAYTISGSPLSNSVINQSGTMDASGALSVVVYNSSLISPTGSTWTITVCPMATSACGTYQFSTSGSSQSISANLTSIIPHPRFNALSPNYGYTDGEAVLTLPVGATYWNVTQNCQRYYNGSTWACGSGGGGGGGTTTNAIVFNNSGTGAGSGVSFNGSTPQTISTNTLGAVATSTTVNAHPLSANVTVTASDVGLGNVTNNAQTQAAVMPNTVPTAGQIPAGNAGGTAYAPVTPAGDVAMDSTGLFTVSGINSSPIPTSALLLQTDSGGHLSAATSCNPLPGTCSVGQMCGLPTGGLNTTAQVCDANNTWHPLRTTNQLAGQCNGVATAASTLSLSGLGTSFATGSCSGTLVPGLGAVMGEPGTLIAFRVRCLTAGVNASSGAFTVMKEAAGAATFSTTSLTVTMGTAAANTIVSDTSHTVAYNAGDLIGVQFTTQAAETLGTCSVSVVYE